MTSNPSVWSTTDWIPTGRPSLVGHQADLRGTADLAAQRERERRAAGRAGGVAVADRAVLPTTRSGPYRTCRCPPTTRSAQPRSRVGSPRLASWTRTVVIRSPSSSAAHAASASRSATSSKERPVSSRQLAEAARARVVDAEEGYAGGPVDHLAVEHRPAVVGQVAPHEVAVVVVAGDRPRGPRRSSSKAALTESRENASHVCPVEVSSPASKTAVAPAASAIARATVHADVVVAVRDQGDDRLALLGLAQLAGRRPPRRRRGRRSCRSCRCRRRSRRAAGCRWW